MLVNCKPGCNGKKASTTASLDVDSNEVICDFCGDTINISEFAKKSMKHRGDIVRRTKKAFQFHCIQCNKKVNAEIVGDKVVGIGCSNNCNINVSKFMVHSMKQLNSKEEYDESDDSGE